MGIPLAGREETRWLCSHSTNLDGKICCTNVLLFRCCFWSGKGPGNWHIDWAHSENPRQPKSLNKYMLKEKSMESHSFSFEPISSCCSAPSKENILKWVLLKIKDKALNNRVCWQEWAVWGSLQQTAYLSQHLAKVFSWSKILCVSWRPSLCCFC